MKKLILASKSPRRIELLKRYTSEFEVVPSNTKEVEFSDNHYYLAMENAKIKARNVAITHVDDCIIAADTIVSLENEVFNKPQNYEQAFSMLEKLSNRTHQVITGVCIINEGQERSFYEVTKVRFKELSSDAIATYLNKIEYLDKAGSYAIQTHSDLIIESYEGLLSNVIGLPIERITQEFCIYQDILELNDNFIPSNDAVIRNCVRAIIVNQKNQFGLLETFKNKEQNRMHDYYESCGGGLYFLEALEAGLRREVEEETGYFVKSFKFFAKYSHRINHKEYIKDTCHYFALIEVDGKFNSENRVSYEKNTLGDVVFNDLETWKSIFKHSMATEIQVTWSNRDLAAMTSAAQLLIK